MPHANDVVAHLSTDQLLHLLRQKKVKVEEGKKKSHYVELAREEIEHQGVKELMNLLKQSELLEIAEPLIANKNIDVEGANKNNKPVLAKRLKDLCDKDGLDAFFNDHFNVDQLKNVIDTLGEDNSSSNHDTLARNAAEATRKAGLSVLLSSLPVAVLQDIAAEGKSKVDSASSGVLIEAIVTGRAPERRAAPPRAESKFSKSKQDIKKGITYQDIFQHYNKDELEEYARKEGLKVAGKKPELIKRILKYLDGDEESTKVQKRKADSDAPAEKKGKKSRKSSEKKPKAEKPKTPKSPSKSKKSKKSSEAPEVAAEGAESK